MSYQVLKGTVDEVTDQLNGAIELGLVPAAGLALGTKTLVFTTPSATVTFSGANGAVRTRAEILAEIKAVLTDATVVSRTATTKNGKGIGPGGSNALLVAWADAGLVLSGGTALPLLEAKAASGTPIAPERVLAFGPENLTAMYYALIAPEA